MQGELRKANEFRIYQILGINWAVLLIQSWKAGREVQDLARGQYPGMTWDLGTAEGCLEGEYLV